MEAPMSFESLKPEPFFNRTRELEALNRAWGSRGSGGQMALLYGRRRLGKTYLLQRYFTSGVRGREEARPHCYYLADQTTDTVQRLTLAHQLLTVLPSVGVAPEEISVSWNALLRYVAQAVNHRDKSMGRFALILDEFPYLVERTPELPSILQAWWDREGVHTPLMVILCGSQLSAMAALGRESAPLFGRFNAGISLLEPLRYDDVAAFYADSPAYSLEDILVMYGVLGGTPRYHALVDTTCTRDEEIVALLMQPRAILENEVKFLLGSEQIRDPAPYNAVLGAIASGETQYGRIQQHTSLEKGTLAFHLKTLQELGWVRRELPFGETSDRRALYRVADPFLAFWYRFVAPLGSVLQFSEAGGVYRDRVAPYLADYMGWHVFEEIAAQWLRRHAQTRLKVGIQRMGRYWSRDGRIKIDIMAELEGGRFLFGECRWSHKSTVGLNVYSGLQAKIAQLPEAHWREKPTCVLFSVGGFAPELVHLAADPQERLHLVAGKDLFDRGDRDVDSD
jgi:AAA+ ATPase superfamily predicted ATPase